MWEKQQESTPQQWPKPVAENKKITDSKQGNTLLPVQLIICALLIAAVFACKTLAPDVFIEVQTEYKTLVTTGVDYSAETELIRFASAGVESIRSSAKGIADGLAGGAGGSYKITKHEVPIGASLDAYTLKEEMLLPVSGTLTSPFGFRENPVDGEDDFHMGADIAANEGTPVKSALDGQVCKTASSALRGNYIIVRHKNGCMTLYQHLLYSYVRAGENVSQGDVIAAVGSTGYVTGPHLHFEIILDGVRVDPAYALDL